MGQINTNNYPTVSSLVDADLLIVENAVHGTGTTTPKQLRENAIGTDALQTTAQTVTGAINEVFEMANVPCGLDLGKMTSFTSGTITTDIDLHREPAEGDRILFYHNSAVASPSSLATYNDGVAVTKSIMDFSMTHPIGLTLMEFGLLGWTTVQDIAAGGYTAGTGISINGTTISNSAPQLGDDIAYSRIDTVTSGALGYFNADADLLVLDFRTNAEPYNGGYTLRLTTTGASFKYAVLKDRAGNNYAEEIPAGSLVMCKSNVSGTGSEADPVVVTVLEIGNTEMVHDVEVLKDICITEKTASGNPITLTDALPYAALSLSADIKADQDLHGLPFPYVGGAYKNKLQVVATSTTTGDLTITVYDDGTMKITGTPNTNRVIINVNTFDFKAGVGYILNGCPANGGNATYNINVAGGVITDTGNGSTVYTPTEDVTYQVRIDIYQAAGNVNLLFKPMIRLSTESDASFAPYSNICPISGHSSVTITDVDAESQTATVTIQLGQTVYGGSLNLTTGVMTITHAIVDLGTNQSDWYMASTITAGKQRLAVSVSDIKIRCTLLCNVFADVTGTETYSCVEGVGTDSNLRITLYKDDLQTLDAWKAFATNNNLQVCYELATPTTIQLTPEQLTMLKGYNRLSSDGGGDITLTYKADRIAAIEAALAAL